jgi:hypothetical protein
MIAKGRLEHESCAQCGVDLTGHTHWEDENDLAFCESCWQAVAIENSRPENCDVCGVDLTGQAHWEDENDLAFCESCWPADDVENLEQEAVTPVAWIESRQATVVHEGSGSAE